MNQIRFEFEAARYVEVLARGYFLMIAANLVEQTPGYGTRCLYFGVPVASSFHGLAFRPKPLCNIQFMNYRSLMSAVN
jgi:hypothetical protein